MESAILRRCVLHIARSMGERFTVRDVKSEISRCAKAKNVHQFSGKWQKFATTTHPEIASYMDAGAQGDDTGEDHDHFHRYERALWAVAYCPVPTYDSSTNNPCELYNAWIRPFRELPTLLWNHVAHIY